MVKFLFWNLNKKHLIDEIVTLAHEHDIDVLMFVEFEIDPTLLLDKLRSEYTPYYHNPCWNCEKVEIFSLYPDIQTISENDRLTVRRFWSPQIQNDILLAVGHFPSKLHWADGDQILECVAWASLIREVEIQEGHKRTIFVGDLNMNPFEDGLVSAIGFHGVMARKIANKETRQVQGISYPFFYNPMWGLFGDISGPPGTYYLDSSGKHISFFWNMFDQVLIRPDLLNMFRNESLKILDSCGEKSLLSNSGKPQPSDHLPIVFELDL